MGAVKLLIALQLMQILGMAVCQGEGACSSIRRADKWRLRPSASSYQEYQQHLIAQYGPSDLGAFSLQAKAQRLRSRIPGGSSRPCSGLNTHAPATPTQPAASPIGVNGYITNTSALATRRHLLQAPPPPDDVDDFPIGRDTAVVWNSLELVQAMLAKSPFIIVAADMDLSDAVPLPSIFHRVTIVGGCNNSLCHLDAMGMSNFFAVEVGGYLTLKNLDLRNGKCSFGGAVSVSGLGSMTMDEGGKFVAINVHFYNNSADTNWLPPAVAEPVIVGGAIAVVDGAMAYYHGCVFINNLALVGGAVYIGPSNFLNNYAQVTALGVLDLTANVSTQAESMPNKCGMSSCASSVDSLFYENWAEVGAGIFTSSALPHCSSHMTGGLVDIMNTRFERNAAAEGGGVFIGWLWGNFSPGAATGQLQNSDFLDNWALGGADVIVIGADLFAYQTSFPNQTLDNEFCPSPQVIIAGHGIVNFAKCSFGGPLEQILLCDQDHDSCEYNICPSSSGLSPNPAPNPPPSPAPSPDVMEDWCVPRMNLCGWVPSECAMPPPPLLV